MLLRRGFKAQCERRSLEIRKTLGLQPIEKLDARILASRLNVAVMSAADVRGFDDPDRHHLLEVACEEWSAFALRERQRFLIVFNPTMSGPRTNSVLMHELSHILLGHELPWALQTEDGHFLNGNYDDAQEAEADWLGATLLLPRPALLWIRSARLTDEIAARHFGVSLDMLRWRVRMTGVDYQMARVG
jgi:Zn-dependent peptidase ImmA (M78 family)